MNFEHIFNAEEVVNHLAAAFGGVSQFDGPTLGLAFAGRMINSGMRTVDPNALDRVIEQAAQMLVGEDGDPHQVIDSIWEGFESRFAWTLEKEGFLTTFFCKEEGGEDAQKWAEGKDHREAYGTVPAKYAGIRGKWDSAWR